MSKEELISDLRSLGLEPSGSGVKDLSIRWGWKKTSGGEWARGRYIAVDPDESLLPAVYDAVRKHLPQATVTRRLGYEDDMVTRKYWTHIDWSETRPAGPPRAVPKTPKKIIPKHSSQKLLLGGLRVNLGAGGERIKGWKSLDLPPERIEEFGLMETEAVLTPDIVAELPDLPFPDNSVTAFRSRDLLMHYEAEGLDFGELGREIRRSLKPGGVLITIENRGFERKLGRWLRIVSIAPGRRIPYMPGKRFLVTTYVKD